jgi:membrane fusion protein (multidrug efflux system)
MWVYFNVPEAGYLQYMAGLADKQDGWRIELVLANGSKFPYPGKIAAIEAQFNNETGTIPFRADFPNPEGLLRHGQTGNILISRTLHNALVIPQRAVFNILEKHFVFVVDKQGHVRQREIKIEHELEDIYVVRSGLDAEEQIILEGIGQVTDGQKVEYEFRDSDEVLRHLKYHAE